MFSHELEEPINESTVRGIKRGYLAQLNEKGVGNECVAIGRLPIKKHVKEIFVLCVRPRNLDPRIIAVI